MKEQDDILAALDKEDENTYQFPFLEVDDIQDNIETTSTLSNEINTLSGENNRGIQDDILNRVELLEETEKKEVLSSSKKIIPHILLFLKFSFTSVFIFGALLVATNYSAYLQIAESYINKEKMEITRQSMIESVAASNIIKEEVKEQQRTFTSAPESNKIPENLHSVSQLVAKASQEDIQLDIEITPYENRIVIPKIGKNIPLVEITETHVENNKELHNIFMKELENGVIRYPGSAKPGENGNSFIFGHSSNFPWLDGEYNDVFALLDKVVYDDEVIVYYGQEKYIYKIRKKEVIRPGDVSILKNQNQDKKEITLMTCWPIGTTHNRLIVIGELVEIQK